MAKRLLKHRGRSAAENVAPVVPRTGASSSRVDISIGRRHVNGPTAPVGNPNNRVAGCLSVRRACPKVVGQREAQQCCTDIEKTLRHRSLLGSAGQAKRGSGRRRPRSLGLCLDCARTIRQGEGVRVFDVDRPIRRPTGSETVSAVLAKSASVAGFQLPKRAPDYLSATHQRAQSGRRAAGRSATKVPSGGHVDASPAPVLYSRVSDGGGSDGVQLVA